MSFPARKHIEEIPLPIDDASSTPSKASLLLPAYAPFPKRGVIAGLVICPIVIFWAQYTEIVSRGADLIAMSLVMAVLCVFLAVLGVNALLRRFLPRLAFSRSDLLMIYIINSVSIGITGLGMMQYLVTMICGASYFKTTDNGWASWSHLLRPWAQPKPEVITAFYDGHSSFFTAANIMGWASPILAWSCFIIMLLTCMYCLATLLRRQWMDSEQLQFPIAVIPLEMMKEGGERPIWRDKVMWSGLGLAFGLQTLAVIHYSFKITFPYVPIKPSEPMFDLTQYLNNPPWNGVGHLQASLYPMVIGLTFLLSLDISFSCWFFFVVTKIESIVATYYGFRGLTDDVWLGAGPYIGFQGVGSFLVLGYLAVVAAGPHFKMAFHEAFFKKDHPAGARRYDADEPLSYKAAFIGFFAGAAGVIGFATALGVALPVSIVFVVILLLYAIVTTRIRAEAGMVFSAAPVPMAHGTMISLYGSHSFSPQTLVGFGLLRWFDSDARNMRMPFQMEAMKIAKDGNINPRHLTVAVVAGTLVAIVSGWLCILGLYYHYGAVTTEPWRLMQGQYNFDYVHGWVTTAHGFNMPGFVATLSGAGVTILLALMRRTFLWWPFHPLGYALANCDVLGWLWLPIIIGWFCKHVVLKYTGTVGYRRALPFFIGLIVGDYAAGGAWSLFFLLSGVPGYRTFPW